MEHAPLRLGDRVVDLDAHEVRHGEQRTALSRNEVALLRCLWERCGQVVSRDTLQQEVLGYAPQVVSRAADFAVHRLRKKLEDDPAQPRWLLTAPGVGFRLVVQPEGEMEEVGEAVQPVRPAPTHNLPADRTSFLGREEDLGELLDRFREGARLVTLLGPAGVGKTRLARATARAWHTETRHAVRFCDLSLAFGAQAAWSTIADALDVDGMVGRDPVARLGAALAGEPRLLVLDNVEQILEPVAQAVRAWLEHAPELRILLTSRERLRSTGEHVHELAPLDDEAGARLFEDRARMARPGFVLRDEAERTPVLQLVQLLDGLPLAIELAAARSAVLSPAAMLERLRQGHEVAHPPRDAPERQSSLSQAMAWSWDLLDDAERSVLAQLTAFRSPFDLEDAEAVVQVAPDPVEGCLQALRDKSLLVEVSTGGAPRFTMLRSVRDFAAARIQWPEALWRRHARWVVERTRQPAWRTLMGDQDRPPELDRLHADLAAAVGRLAGLVGEQTLTAEAVTAAHATWLLSERPETWLEHAARALQAEADLPPEVAVRLHLSRAVFLQSHGVVPQAEASCQAILARLGPESVRPEVVAVHLLQAAALHLDRRLDEAWLALERARVALRGQPPDVQHIKLELQAGNILLAEERYPEADRQYRRALASCERAGLSSFEPLITLNLAVLRGWEGRVREQASTARRALLSARANENRKIERRALLMLAVAQSELGELDEARRHGHDAVDRGEEDHDAGLVNRALVTLASVDFAAGDMEAVLRHVRRARTQEARLAQPQDRAYIDMWEGLACWARWASLDDAIALLEQALERAGHYFPLGAPLMESRLLAARAHRDPDAIAELEQAYAALEARTATHGRPDLLRAMAIDRTHLALARAARAAARGQAPGPHLGPVRAALEGGLLDIAVDGLPARHSRVLLASALAELEHALPDGEAWRAGRG